MTGLGLDPQEPTEGLVCRPRGAGLAPPSPWGGPFPSSRRAGGGGGFPRALAAARRLEWGREGARPGQSPGGAGRAGEGDAERRDERPEWRPVHHYWGHRRPSESGRSDQTRGGRITGAPGEMRRAAVSPASHPPTLRLAAAATPKTQGHPLAPRRPSITRRPLSRPRGRAGGQTPTPGRMATDYVHQPGSSASAGGGGGHGPDR